MELVFGGVHGKVAPGFSRPAICLFTDSHEPSGVGEHMLALATRLAGRFRLSLVCPPTDGGRRLLARATAAGLDVLPADPLRRAGDWRHARAWLRARAVDVLHVHAGISWEGLAAPELAQAAGVGAVLRTEHLPFLSTDDRDRAAYAAAIGAVDHIICVSDGVLRSFAAAGVPGPLVSAIPNGVEPPAPGRRPIATHDTASAPTFVTVARLTAQKGLDVLIEATVEVIARAPDARFQIVGTGPLEGELRSLAQARGVARRVEFLGHRQDVPALLAGSAAFVLPSRFEGLPLALLEAMAKGVPVIATDVCGNADAVVHGESGLLVPADDVAALAAAMVRLVEFPRRAAAMGRRARARVLSRFCVADMAEATASHYARLSGTRLLSPEMTSVTFLESA